MTAVPFLKPTFPEALAVASDYEEIVRAGIFSNGGPFDSAFTDGLQRWIGGGVQVTTVANCTAALELAIQALVPNAGSKVLVASFTFAAGPLAVLRCGHTPIFLDVDLSSWQPSLEHAKTLLKTTPKPAAILLTNTFGVANSSIDEWEALARQHGIALILDSAAGFGSIYKWGEPLGSRGDCEVFSFHATKMLAIGEGGALATRRSEVIEQVRRLKNFGFDSHRQATSIGTNAKLPELAAAIGNRQLKALPQRLLARRAVLQSYRELLPDVVQFQPGAKDSAPAFVSALLPSSSLRDAIVDALEREAIESRIYYNPPVHRQSVFASNANLEVTDDLASRIISLPMADDLARETIAKICGIMATKVAEHEAETAA